MGEPGEGLARGPGNELLEERLRLNHLAVTSTRYPSTVVSNPGLWGRSEDILFIGASVSSSIKWEDNNISLSEQCVRINANLH